MIANMNAVHKIMM